MTDTLHAFHPPAKTLGAAANPLPTSLFGPRPITASIVYKRRRLAATAPVSPTPGARTIEAAAAGERQPRVVRVAAPAAPDPADAVDSAPAPAPAVAAPPSRRRRGRDPLRAPGAVRHIVFDRADEACAADGEPLRDARTPWAPMYPRLRRSLDAVAATLEQARQLRRCADELQALLPAAVRSRRR